MYLQMCYDQFDILYVSGERYLVQEVDSQPPHKIDENMWKNREHIEEIIFLLETSHWPKLLQQQSTTEDIELARLLKQLREKCGRILEIVESFQSKNAENVFNTVMTYMPQDFRGTLIRKQRERSEKNKKAQVDALVSAGGSIRDRYALLWQQQMERRRQLAQLGSAGGVYKTVVKYLVGVPQVLLDFVRQINDDQGPMEEQRHRYGPPMYALTKLVSLEVDSVNSYIAWDFSIAQGKISMDIGFSIEYTNSSGRKTLILPYRRYDSDQGNFCTISAGNYKLIWDNSFSTFFKKALRYKVDCIPPVVEPDAEERGTL
ncbi:putative GOLD domain-containing protein [Helianthus annuus]|nr:putative GOLD domain-containing protein [Helianthus annuus]